MVAGQVEGRFGAKRSLVAAASLAFVMFVLLALVPNQPAVIYLVSAVSGAGIGLAYAVLPNLIVSAVPADETGVATGINTIARTIGGAFGSQVVGTILAASAAANGGQPVEQAFVVSMWLGAGALAVAAIAASTIPGRTAEAEPLPTRSSAA